MPVPDPFSYLRWTTARRYVNGPLDCRVLFCTISLGSRGGGAVFVGDAKDDFR